MKQAFLEKKLFILNSRMKVLQMKTTKMLKQFRKNLVLSMKDYHILYNLSDVLLLADVFENFRNICTNHYGLDPARYYSAPGFFWDAALQITKVQLELLSDPDMLLMIESGIRGEIATISHRYAKANNEYMETEFDPTKNSKFISYLDANNLYGWAMSKQLPKSEFEWMTGSVQH